MNDLELPAMLYKRDGSILDWDGKMWDTLIVATDEELEAALADGWETPSMLTEPQEEKPRRGRPPKERPE